MTTSFIERMSVFKNTMGKVVVILIVCFCQAWGSLDYDLSNDHLKRYYQLVYNNDHSFRRDRNDVNGYSNSYGGCGCRENGDSSEILIPVTIVAITAAVAGFILGERLNSM